MSKPDPPDYEDPEEADNEPWTMEASSGVECDCQGPPPEFLLPPPPRPPMLQPDPSSCSEDALLEVETCDALPVSSYLLENSRENLI